MSNPIKGFHILNRAWYARSGEAPEIMIGLYYKDGSCDAEFAVRWHRLSAFNSSHDHPRLEIFGDAWATFFTLGELHDLGALAKHATQEDVVSLLLRHGYTDLTKYDRPADATPMDDVHGYDPKLVPPKPDVSYLVRVDDGEFKVATFRCALSEWMWTDDAACLPYAIPVVRYWPLPGQGAGRGAA